MTKYLRKIQKFYGSVVTADIYEGEEAPEVCPLQPCKAYFELFMKIIKAIWPGPYSFLLFFFF